MYYVNKVAHGSGFPAGTSCEVCFRTKRASVGTWSENRFFAIVRRPLKDWEKEQGRSSDVNHPDHILYFPRPDYWFWPELEDEDTARRLRERTLYNKQKPGALLRLRKLKPY